MGSGQSLGASGRRLGGGQPHRSRQVPLLEPFPQTGFQRFHMGQHHRSFGLQRHAEAGHGALKKSPGIIGRPQKRAHLLPFGRHLLGLHGVLGEAGAGFPFVLRHVPPAGLHGRGALIKAQIKGQLGGGAPPQHHGGQQRIGDGTPFPGKGHGDARGSADVLGFAQDHLQHGAVNSAVRGEHHDGAHQRRRLPETIHPAFPLLVAGGIPTQVVVNHRVEQLLEVDAF